MDIYNYDATTGILIPDPPGKQSTAAPNPLDAGEFLIPAFATTITPPAPQLGKAIVFARGVWTFVADFRGQVIYDIVTAVPETIGAIGDVPAGKTLLVPPSEFPFWLGTSWGQSPAAIPAAASKKKADIENYCDALQQANFTFNGHSWYNDKNAQADFSATRARISRLALTDPVPTPAPITGTWKSADLDTSGNNVMVPLTVGGFLDLTDALYDHISSFWIKKVVKLATIDGMVKAGATAAQIAAYDITTGW
jgi:hypothetical protein